MRTSLAPQFLGAAPTLFSRIGRFAGTGAICLGISSTLMFVLLSVVGVSYFPIIHSSWRSAAYDAISFTGTYSGYVYFIGGFFTPFFSWSYRPVTAAFVSYTCLILFILAQGKSQHGPLLHHYGYIVAPFLTAPLGAFLGQRFLSRRRAEVAR